MIALITETGLFATSLLAIFLSVVTLNNPVGSKPIGRIWIAFNTSVFLWSSLWTAGAFFCKTVNSQWLAIYLASLCAIAMPPLFLCFVTVLLNRSLRQSKLIRIGIIVSIALVVLCVMFPHSFFTPGVHRVGDAYLPTGGVLLWVFSVQYAILLTAGVFLLLKEVGKLSGSQRNRILYVLVGSAIGSGAGLSTFLVGLGIVKTYPYPVVLLAVYSALLTHAITRHRLMDITVVIRKTLIYGAVMGTLTTGYLLTISMLAHIFQGLTGSQTAFSSAVAAGLIAICFQPLRKRVQALVDRKFFRQYVDREEKLYELSREVITHTTPEAMGGALMHVLNETLHPKGGALFLRTRDGGGFTKVSSVGHLSLPERMEEENELAMYFKDHPQPFVQEISDEIGQSLSTREKENREAAA